MHSIGELYLLVGLFACLWLAVRFFDFWVVVILALHKLGAWYFGPKGSQAPKRRHTPRASPR